jgi:putative transposase
MAIRQRRPDAGLIHHSDQGSQYADGRYQAVLKAYEFQPSTNGVATWYDDAPMESFLDVLKSEQVYHRLCQTSDEARPDVFQYIEGFYNRCQLPSLLGYLSSDAHGRLYH